MAPLKLIQTGDDESSRGPLPAWWRILGEAKVSFGVDGVLVPDEASAAPNLTAPETGWTLGLPGEDDIPAFAQGDPIVCYGGPDDDLALAVGSLDDGWVFGA